MTTLQPEQASHSNVLGYGCIRSEKTGEITFFLETQPEWFANQAEVNIELTDQGALSMNIPGVGTFKTEVLSAQLQNSLAHQRPWICLCDQEAAMFAKFQMEPKSAVNLEPLIVEDPLSRASASESSRVRQGLKA